MERPDQAIPGEWDIVDDGCRVILDVDDERAADFLGDHALTLHVDLLPWVKPCGWTSRVARRAFGYQTVDGRVRDEFRVSCS